MPEIVTARTALARRRGNLPRLRLVNMFAEESPTEQKGITLQSRKGLDEYLDLGSGPIRATFQRDGVLSGTRITVSGGQVYSGSTLVGSIDGDDAVSIDGDNDEILLTGGGSLYRYDGSTLAAVSFPDGSRVTKIVQLAGYFIAIRKDDFPQRWYFGPVGSGASFDGLDYASAENEPDRLYDALVVNDGLVFLGAETIEFWARTGDANLPFSAIEQRVFNKGVKNTGCAVAEDNSFFWIGNDNIVYRGANVPVAISDDGITERIAASSSHAMYAVADERHRFVVVRLDTETWAYDVTTRQWCEWASDGRDNFRGACSDGTYLGDDETGKLWRFSGYQDAGGTLTRVVGGGFPVTGGVVPVNNVRIRCEVGTTGYLSGDYTPAEIEMRFSDDGGNTWSDWEAESLGAQGDYRTMPEWRALGLADYPGRVFEFRVSDPVSFRFSGAFINEEGGGGSR